MCVTDVCVCVTCVCVCACVCDKVAYVWKRVVLKFV